MQGSGSAYQHIPAFSCALCGALITSTGMIEFRSRFPVPCAQDNLGLWLASLTTAVGPADGLTSH